MGFSTRLAAILFVLVTTVLAGCGTATPRFGPDVQAAVAGEMRRMETPSLLVYYPEGAKAEAARVAARIEACADAVRDRTVIKNDWGSQKLKIVLPSLPFNNAYVAPPALSEPISVVPTFFTSDVFATLGIPPDPAVIGCHEVTHYVQLLQVGGFNSGISEIFGPLYSAQTGFDGWFIEGVAVYYETRLQNGLGRLRQGYFQGILAAAAGETEIDTGLTNVAHREPLYGGPYLLGAAFVDWLVEKYGETDLFRVISKQGRSVLFPFGIEGRFRDVYHLTATALFKDFAYDLKRRHPKTPRPEAQRVVLGTDAIGVDARFARGRSGHEALVVRDLDRPTRLVVRDPSCRAVVERNLTDILPGRTLVAPQPSNISGLSFTADGSRLYFVVVDQGSLYQASRLVVVDTRTGALDVVADDLGGSGGSIAADGSTYWYAKAAGDGWGIAALDLATRRSRWVRAPEAGVFHTGVRVSPDGGRLAVVRNDRRGFWIAIVDARTGAIARELTPKDGTALGPDWVDDDRVLFTLTRDGRMQVHVASVSEGKVEEVTRAPYLPFMPQSDGRSVRFLNRVGWRWSLDEAPLEPQRAPDPRPPVPPPHAIREREMVDSPLQVVRDEPYSSLERIYVPQARGLWFVSRDGDGAFGLSMNGGDPLGRHRWGVAAAYAGRGLVSGEVGYVNGQLAPVTLSAAAAHYGSYADLVAGPIGGAGDSTVISRETVAAVTASRTFYRGTELATGLRYDGVDRSVEGAPLDVVDARFGGYSASASYVAYEVTPYTGARRALWLGAGGTSFPKLFEGQPFAVGDGQVAAGAYVPLLLRRLIFGVDLRGRFLAGAPSGTGLLQIGGASTTAPSVRNASSAAPLGSDANGLLPPGVRFYEALAGFEDFARFDRGAGLGEATLRYPLIVDWGSLSSFYLFPSFLLRQVDLVAFAAGARFVDQTRPAAAAGGRFIARIAFAEAPLSFMLQIARRLTDDEKVATYFMIGVE